MSIVDSNRNLDKTKSIFHERYMKNVILGKKINKNYALERSFFKFNIKQVDLLLKFKIFSCQSCVIKRKIDSSIYTKCESKLKIACMKNVIKKKNKTQIYCSYHIITYIFIIFNPISIHEKKKKEIFNKKLKTETKKK